MKIDPYYHRQKCRTMALVSGGIRSMRIFGRFPGEGHQRIVGLSRTGNFQRFRLFFGYRRDEVSVIIRRYAVRRRFSVIPKCIRMTLNGYFALNFVIGTVCLAETVRLSKNNSVKLITIEYRHTVSGANLRHGL